jgi:hypothetical protein
VESQPRHLFDELVAEPIAFSGSLEVLGAIGESPDDGHLRPKAGQSSIRRMPTVVA